MRRPTSPPTTRGDGEHGTCDLVTLGAREQVAPRAGAHGVEERVIVGVRAIQLHSRQYTSSNATVVVS
jgi:hypothetical protein